MGNLFIQRVSGYYAFSDTGFSRGVHSWTMRVNCERYYGVIGVIGLAERDSHGHGHGHRHHRNNHNSHIRRLLGRYTSGHRLWTSTTDGRVLPEWFCCYWCDGILCKFAGGEKKWSNKTGVRWDEGDLLTVEVDCDRGTIKFVREMDVEDGDEREEHEIGEQEEEEEDEEEIDGDDIDGVNGDDDQKESGNSNSRRRRKKKNQHNNSNSVIGGAEIQLADELVYYPLVQAYASKPYEYTLINQSHQ